ncbi:MAG: DnaJ domain-containing protein [Cytophaga sp.]|uniref:DnaJ domain-containing protein n=1 Tax=Cytophaga sp. TaxID=29535 RepID=UPI003F821F42
MTDYYRILGLEHTASAQDIKKAYRKLSLKFHPDKNGGDEFFENMFKQINEAYEILSNPSKKATYDRNFGKSKQYSQSYSNNYQKHKDPDPSIVFFLSDKSSFYTGDTITFEWKTLYADKVMIQPFGVMLSEGSKSFRLTNFNKEYLTVIIEATNYKLNKTVYQTIRITNNSFSTESFKSESNTTENNSKEHFHPKPSDNFFSIKGRLRRKDYIKRFLLLLFIPIVLNAFVGESGKHSDTFLMVIIVFFIGLSVLIQSIKRLHDVNLGGIFCVLLIMPIVNTLFIIYLFFAPGTRGTNKYGLNPKE